MFYFAELHEEVQEEMSALWNAFVIVNLFAWSRGILEVAEFLFIAFR
jgi:hypothetical protein